jgi:hypothetical protein
VRELGRKAPRILDLQWSNFCQILKNIFFMLITRTFLVLSRLRKAPFGAYSAGAIIQETGKNDVFFRRGHDVCLRLPRDGTWSKIRTRCLRRRYLDASTPNAYISGLYSLVRSRTVLCVLFIVFRLFFSNLVNAISPLPGETLFKFETGSG